MNRVPKFCLGVLVLALLLGMAAPALAAEAKGKIASVAGDKSEFVMAVDGKNWMFHHDKDGKVLINGKEAKLSDLKAGDEATVTYETQGEQLVCREIRCTRK